jgi:hypothetical protein
LLLLLLLFGHRGKINKNIMENGTCKKVEIIKKCGGGNSLKIVGDEERGSSLSFCWALASVRRSLGSAGGLATEQDENLLLDEVLALEIFGIIILIYIK